MKKSKKKVIIVISSILGVILLGAAAGAAYTYSTFNKVNKVEITKSKEELGIPDIPSAVTDKEIKNNKVTNILLMAVDNQENASDTLIVLTLDDTNKKIKLTSIMRDSYVELGKGKTNKINYAYHYGGPILSIKTINENYKLDIMNYIKVDFVALEGIIDDLGGVDINLKKEELSIINQKIDDQTKVTKDKKTYVDKAGVQTLNGQQAVAYARVRVVGNGDFERTERQRTILTSLFNKLKDTSPAKYPSMVANIAKYFETSLDNGDMLSIASKAASYGLNGIEQTRLPLDGTWKHDTNSGPYYLRWDKSPNLEHLHKFIYGNVSRLGDLQ